MAVAVLEWRSRRAMTQVQRWVVAPGHASMVLLFPDKSGNTHGFAHTITWFPGQGRFLSGQQSEGSSATTFGSKGKWVPDNVFKEMVHMGARPDSPTLREWFATNDNGWVKMYKDHLIHPQANFAFGTILDTLISPPDRQVTIMSRGDPGAYTGLFDANIRTWWLAFANQNNTYKFLTRSCAGVVGMALVAGGAENWVSKPAGIWTPDSVFGWAEQLSKEIEKENNLIHGAFESLKSEADKHKNPGPVWTRKEWYAASEANVSIFSRRYGLLLAIDDLLDCYHGIDARDITEEFKKQAKLNCLCIIMENLVQILKERATSKRKDAIGKLAAQIRGVFRKIKEEEEEIQEKLRRERELLLEEVTRHNEPINARLKEISTEQFNLMRKMQFGKIKDPLLLKQLIVDNKKLSLEREELQSQLRSVD